MSKRLFLLTVLALAIQLQSFAAEMSQRLLLLLKMKPQQATTQQVVSLLGQPTKTESTTWYYESNSSSLTLHWNRKTSLLERYSFEAKPTSMTAWDDAKARFLKMGETELAQVISLLGTPKDMTIKAANQQLHYAYQDNVLNLFFHKGMLVNYTLY